ncbi:MULTISPECIES: YjcQ family protein [Bacillus amyloliquefaciens group]|uniref:YjcQ family protein n=1 Tax=Bacillus amyloliquefaciens group TaxID=1938374 RepID=UPI0011A3F2AA
MQLSLEMGNPVKTTLLNHVKVTFEGMEYLEQNNDWAITYNTIKELRDWIK